MWWLKNGFLNVTYLVRFFDQQLYYNIDFSYNKMSIDFFLVHPNVKLFISHGGISGVYETVDAGVPVLGFPLFYDQHRNIANLVDAGMAISMELLSVSTVIVLNSILELINNEK